MKCKYCGYEWKARTKVPKKCPNPNCQKPLIDYPKPKKEKEKPK